MSFPIEGYQNYVRLGLSDRVHLGKPMDADTIIMEMVGELGEVLNAYKHARKWPDPKPTEEAHLGEELGDLLWYMFAVCSILGFDVEDIIRNNINKLNDRYGYGSAKD